MPFRPAGRIRANSPSFSWPAPLPRRDCSARCCGPMATNRISPDASSSATCSTVTAATWPTSTDWSSPRRNQSTWQTGSGGEPGINSRCGCRSALTHRPRLRRPSAHILGWRQALLVKYRDVQEVPRPHQSPPPQSGFVSGCITEERRDLHRHRDWRASGGHLDSTYRGPCQEGS